MGKRNKKVKISLQRAAAAEQLSPQCSYCSTKHVAGMAAEKEEVGLVVRGVSHLIL